MISVIIPVYNAEKYLERAVISALDQSETGEVILVEDNSPDNALELCQKLEKDYNKVKLFRHLDGKNHGAGASRNLGVEKASLGYIAFLDADDYYLPNRFKKTVEVFNKHSDADGVYECIGTDFSSEEKKIEWYKRRSSSFTTIKENVAPEDLLEAITIGDKGYFSLDGLTVKKEIFRKIGYFDVDLRLTQDTEISVRMAAVCKLYPGSIDVPVAKRFWHEKNRTGKKDKEEKYYRKLCGKKLLYWSKNNLNPKERKIIFLFSKKLFYSEALKKNGLLYERYYELKQYFDMMFFHRVLLCRYIFVGLIGVFSKKVAKFLDFYLL